MPLTVLVLVIQGCLRPDMALHHCDFSLERQTTTEQASKQVHFNLSWWRMDTGCWISRGTSYLIRQNIIHLVTQVRKMDITFSFPLLPLIYNPSHHLTYLTFSMIFKPISFSVILLYLRQPLSSIRTTSYSSMPGFVSFPLLLHSVPHPFPYCLWTVSSKTYIQPD